MSGKKSKSGEKKDSESTKRNKFQVGDEVVVIKDWDNNYTYEVGKLYTIRDVIGWEHLSPGVTWYDCGEINIPEHILVPATKLYKALR